jgi:uracil-DNA glycosylase
MILMGDVAIKSLNHIVKERSGKRIIPNGSTYKIRHDEFYYGDIRVFPSYLQTGQNYLIERSKRQMISEDIRNALELIN